MLLCRHKYIVTALFQTDTQTTETVGNDSQVFIRHILDSNFTSRHGSHSDKTADLNHIWKHPMRTAFQARYTFDGKQVRCNARNLGSHAIQHPAQLLQIRFTGCIVNRGHSFGQYSCHHNIGRTGHRSLIQQHISPFQLLGIDAKTTIHGIIFKRSTQFLNTQEVRIQTATPDFITTRFRNHCLSEASYQRAYQHYRATQFRATAQEVITLQVSQVQIISLKSIRITSRLRNLHPHVAKQLYQVVHIQNVRNVFNSHFLICQQCGTKYL